MSPTGMTGDWWSGYAPKQYGAAKQSKLAAKDYIQQGEMGVDPAAFQIGSQWTSQFDQSGQNALGRSIGAEWQGQQRDLNSMLMDQARGYGGSVADIQMMRGLQAAQAQQQSAAAGAMGANRALANRTAMQNMGMLAQDISGQGAQLRAQEQMNAMGLMNQLQGQARGQDIQTQGLNDALMQYYMSQGFSRDAAMQQAAAQGEALKAQNYGVALGGGAQVPSGGLRNTIIGGGISAGGAAAAGALSKP